MSVRESEIFFNMILLDNDGGINFDNSKLAIEAGANILVSGTTISKNNNGNIKKNIDTLKAS